MNLNIEISENICFKYELKSKDEMVINIKRFIRKKLNLKKKTIKFMNLFKSINKIPLIDSEKIIRVLKNDEHIFLKWRILSGPKLDKTENIFIEIKIDNYEIPIIKKKFNPAQKIYEIINYALEIMYDFKKHNFIHSDMELKFNNKILNSNKQLAKYQKISRSYLQFNNQDYNWLLNKLGDYVSEDCYYHNLVIGNEISEKIILTLNKKSYPPFAAIEQKSHFKKCIFCKNIDINPVILPCCRKYCCENCGKSCRNFVNCKFCDKLLIG